jgi:hypothetical protein
MDNDQIPEFNRKFISPFTGRMDVYELRKYVYFAVNMLVTGSKVNNTNTEILFRLCNEQDFIKYNMIHKPSYRGSNAANDKLCPAFEDINAPL